MSTSIDISLLDPVILTITDGELAPASYAINSPIHIAAVIGAINTSNVLPINSRIDILEDNTTLLNNLVTSSIADYIPETYYDIASSAANATTLSTGQYRIELIPFISSKQLHISTIGIEVTVAGDLNRFMIYSSDSNGWPDTLLLSTADVDVSSIGYKYAEVDFILAPNTQYWLATWNNGAITYTACSLFSVTNLGLLSETGSSYITKIRRYLAFSSPTPSPWVFDTSELLNGAPASIRMRAVL